MNRSVLIVAAIFGGLLMQCASANPVTYNLVINTSSIAGTSGALDFNFNPGPLTTQSASVTVSGFSGNGALVGSPISTGDVSGALPGSVALDNGTAFNDYFQGFTFGSLLSLNISLFGPALEFPDGVATSGSAFAFSMFSDSAGTIPVLTTNPSQGFAFTVDVNLDGTTTATSFLSTPQAVPEPSSSLLVAIAAISWPLATYKKYRASRAAKATKTE